ncbi:hypothetical protein [Eudoraea sp.]|uniref:hypothetical protein n=1 Tax=Eudoraea sp. TaxID=1979955 RepID=UPI003C72B4E0
MKKISKVCTKCALRKNEKGLHICEGLCLLCGPYWIAYPLETAPAVRKSSRAKALLFFIFIPNDGLPHSIR